MSFCTQDRTAPLIEEVRTNVQAVLLNSECHPEDATRVTLEALATFAFGEEILDKDAWLQLCAEAFEQATKTP